MVNHLANLEKKAKELEPDTHHREKLMLAIHAYAENFLQNLPTDLAYTSPKGAETPFLTEEFDEEGQSVEHITQVLKEQIDHEGLNPASAGHLGYIPGSGLYASALGDFLAAIMNRYAGLYFASPGAVKCENTLIEWMRKIVGFPSSAGGYLASGGSIANLSCLIAARDAKKLSCATIPTSVIYLSEQTHHCVEKAVRMGGMGECVLRFIELDERFRLIPQKLEEQIYRDIDQGLSPFLLISSVGTTDTGAVDPISQLADICLTHGLWHHVDAAYGGFFMLCEEGKSLTDGIDKTDSIVLDPHKGLFLPYGTGAAIVKDVQHLYNSHYYQANYMQDASSDTVYSPADLSPELTKHFRGLRLWIPLKLFGLAPFRAALSEKIHLTRYFYDEIQKIKGIETGPFPELSVTFFRYVPPIGDADVVNQKIVDAIHQDGRVFLSSTRIRNIFYIRMAILNFRTHKNTIDLALQVIKNVISRIQDGDH